jgi:hypothetical protein
MLSASRWRASKRAGPPHAVRLSFGSEDEIAQSGLSDLARITERDLTEGTDALRKWRDIFVAFYVAISTEIQVGALRKLFPRDPSGAREKHAIARST